MRLNALPCQQLGRRGLKLTSPLLTGTTILLVLACSGSNVIGNFSSLRTWRKMKWWKLYKRDNSAAVRTTSRVTLIATVTSPDLVNTGNCGTFRPVNNQQNVTTWQDKTSGQSNLTKSCIGPTDAVTDKPKPPFTPQADAHKCANAEVWTSTQEYMNSPDSYWSLWRCHQPNYDQLFHFITDTHNKQPWLYHWIETRVKKTWTMHRGLDNQTTQMTHLTATKFNIQKQTQMLMLAYQWQLSFTQNTKAPRSVFRSMYRAPSGVLLLCNRTSECHMENIQITWFVRLWSIK